MSTPTDPLSGFLAHLDATAAKATPPRDANTNWQYHAADNARRELIAACDPETVAALVAVARAALTQSETLFNYRPADWVLHDALAALRACAARRA